MHQSALVFDSADVCRFCAAVPPVRRPHDDDDGELGSKERVDRRGVQVERVRAAGGERERDRLTQELRRKLSACGWDERLRKYCAEVVRERGSEQHHTGRPPVRSHARRPE